MSGQLFILLMMNMMMMMLMLVVVVVKKIADNDEKPLLVLVHICNCSHKLTSSHNLSIDDHTLTQLIVHTDENC